MEEIEKFLSEINKRYSAAGKPEPIWQNELSYDSSIETLEPVYYWILDFVNGAKYKVTKLADNFTAAPGSSYFADLGQRATKMQEEGMKILGTINAVIKSIINVLYDLKEFEIRLDAYKRAEEGKTKAERESGMLALKDIWMSNVDIKRGRGSINQMTYELGFSTLRDAFMKAESPEDVDKMDLNERVKRVLKPRIAEFLQWKEVSYGELKRRFNIEKAYLQSQVDTLKLYSSWVRPYLLAAEQLRMKEVPGLGPPELISAFGTMVLNLSLMLTKEIDVKDEVENKFLPETFKKAEIRKFYQVIFIDYTFRTYPTQQFPHAGRVDIKFKAYAANSDELAWLQDKIKQDQTNSMLGLAGNLSSETLKQLEEEIDYFTKKPKKKEEKKKEEGMFFGILKDFMKTLNPGEEKKELVKKYSELYEEVEGKETDEKAISELPVQTIKNLVEELESKKKSKAKLKEIKEKGVEPDNYYEGIVRNLAELYASEFCFKIFDTFKKSRGMASFPSPFDEPDVYQRLREKRAEIAAALKK